MLLIIGIILCTVAVVALAAILFLVLVRPFNNANAPEPPQVSQVQEVFEDASTPTPKLDSFMYINDEGLSDPELSDFKTGKVTEDSSAKGSFICEGEARATFQNASVKAVVPLTVPMTRAAEATSWVPGGVESGSPEVSPTGPADIQAMQDNIQNILKGFNQDVANQFVDCEVRPEASLNAQGGTVIFNLSKAVSEEEVKTCTVNTDVTWGDAGWDVKVTSVDGLEEEPAAEEQNEEPLEPESTDGGDRGSSSGSGTVIIEQGSSSGSGGSTELYPTMLLECWSGDLVRVPGTIQVQSNGSVLLRTDDVIQVIFDGRTYITTYFELTGVGSFQNGQHVMVDGAITANGSNPIAPLVINIGWY